MNRENEPFLFEGMTDEKLGSASMPATAYMDPVEALSFAIMEELDLLLKKNITIEQYDTAQRSVKKILSEALCEKTPGTLGPNGRPLLIVRKPDYSI